MARTAERPEPRLPPSVGLLAVGVAPRIVQVIDPDTGGVCLDTTGHTSEVLAAAVSANGEKLASAGKARLPSAAAGPTVGPAAALDPFAGLAPRQTRFASAKSGAHGRPPALAPRRARLVTPSPRPRSQDCSFHVWDVCSGAYALGVRGHNRRGACVCAVGDDGYLSPPSRCPVEGHAEAVQCIALSPRGSRIATGAWDTEVALWDTRFGQARRSPLRPRPDLPPPLAPLLNPAPARTFGRSGFSASRGTGASWAASASARQTARCSPAARYRPPPLYC